MQKEIKETTKQFNFMTTLLAAAFIIVVVVFFMSFRKLARTEPTMMKSNEISSSSDLNKAGMELDSANLDEMDSDLDQVSSDSSSL